MQAVFAKIISFIMAILAFLGLVKPQTPAAEPDSYTVNGRVVTFCFDSNPSTGYGWQAVVDGDCVTLTRDEYEGSKTEPGVAGAGGYQYYDFTAVKPGTAKVTFTYLRPWEATEADRVVVAEIAVAEDLSITSVRIG